MSKFIPPIFMSLFIIGLGTINLLVANPMYTHYLSAGFCYGLAAATIMEPIIRKFEIKPKGDQ